MCCKSRTNGLSALKRVCRGGPVARRGSPPSSRPMACARNGVELLLFGFPYSAVIDHALLGWKIPIWRCNRQRSARRRSRTAPYLGTGTIQKDLAISFWYQYFPNGHGEPIVQEEDQRFLKFLDGKAEAWIALRAPEVGGRLLHVLLPIDVAAFVDGIGRSQLLRRSSSPRALQVT